MKSLLYTICTLTALLSLSDRLLPIQASERVSTHVLTLNHLGEEVDDGLNPVGSFLTFKSIKTSPLEAENPMPPSSEEETRAEFRWLKAMEARQRLQLTLMDPLTQARAERLLVGLDDIAPTLQEAITKNYSDGLNATVFVEATDEGGSGIDVVAYSLDEGENWDELTTTSLTVSPTEGVTEQSVWLKARDMSGNETQKEVRVSFDVEGPTLTVKLDTVTKWVNRARVITVTATDESGIKSYTLPSGKVVQVADTPQTLTFTSEANAVGDYLFTVTDTLGNVSTQSIFVDLVDRTLPNLGLNNPTNGQWSSNRVTIQLNGSN